MVKIRDYSHELGLENLITGLAVCLGLPEPRFVYIGLNFRLSEIWFQELGSFFGFKPIADEADAPRAVQLSTFVDTSIGKKFVVFLDGGSSTLEPRHVHAIYWSAGAIGTKNLTGEARGW